MRTMYMWIMELESQFYAFLDSPYFPLSLSVKTDWRFSTITISYFVCAQGALVATRAVSCLSSTYPFLPHRSPARRSLVLSSTIITEKVTFLHVDRMSFGKAIDFLQITCKHSLS
jgi:hypothetical protein